MIGHVCWFVESVTGWFIHGTCCDLSKSKSPIFMKLAQCKNLSIGFSEDKVKVQGQICRTENLPYVTAHPRLKIS